MTKCVFCGREESPFRGVHLITNVGSVDFYCSGKCRKNALNLGRDKRRLKWTAAFAESREKAALAEKRNKENEAARAVENAAKKETKQKAKK
ncbi:MAG: 50S ribosomal protein L24e [archaeon]|jgi:large subunit ribosomal protein L24e|nr:50S ribosomal protein L24e [archaeon]